MFWFFEMSLKLSFNVIDGSNFNIFNCYSLFWEIFTMGNEYKLTCEKKRLLSEWQLPTPFHKSNNCSSTPEAIPSSKCCTCMFVTERSSRSASSRKCMQNVSVFPIGWHTKMTGYPGEGGRVEGSILFAYLFEHNKQVSGFLGSAHVRVCVCVWLFEPNIMKIAFSCRLQRSKTSRVHGYE